MVFEMLFDNIIIINFQILLGLGTFMRYYRINALINEHRQLVALLNNSM